MHIDYKKRSCLPLEDLVLQETVISIEKYFKK